MQNNSLVYYHKDNINKLKVYGICTKLNLNLYDCNTYSVLGTVINKSRPAYIIYDTQDPFEDSLIEEITEATKDTKIYIINSDYISFGVKNVYFVENLECLENIIANHDKTRKCTQDNYYNLENEFQNFIYNEMHKLSFRAKLKGVRYLSDLVYCLMVDCNKNKTCTQQYEIISKKYDISFTSIERSIRFSISSAYKTCKDKQLFYDISKTFRTPSVKEIAYYILEKLLLTQCFNQYKNIA